MRGAVGEIELAALALLDVLDVSEQEAGAVVGVRDHAVAQRDPQVRPVAAPEAQFRVPALGVGAEQGAYVLGVDKVGERVAAHGGGRAAQHAAQRVVRSEDDAVAVAADLGDGHTVGRVLEGLPEGFLAGPQRLLLLFLPDQYALHVRT